MDGFLTHLKLDRQVSTHTLQAYESDLEQFQFFLKKPIQQANTQDIEKFLAHLRKRQLSDRSIARKITTLRRFYLFLISEGTLKNDPTKAISLPTLPKRLPKAISKDSVEKILSVLDEGLPYLNHPELRDALVLRDRALVLFLYASGARVSELITLKTKDLDLENGTARVTGKRMKQRLVPFPPLVSHVLHDYLKQSRPKLNPHSDVLFLGAGGVDLSRQAVFLILKKIAAAAGLSSNVSPHQFRHTFATELVSHGMNLRSLQTLLGHADLQTTQIYTHVAPERLKHVIRKFHPRGSK